MVLGIILLCTVAKGYETRKERLYETKRKNSKDKSKPIH